MVKKVKTKAKPEAEEKEQPIIEESLTVLQKKENAKLLKKQAKKIGAEVAQRVDVKQVISAVKALQKYHKSQKENGKLNLLDDEDGSFVVTFTMT